VVLQTGQCLSKAIFPIFYSFRHFLIPQAHLSRASEKCYPEFFPPGTRPALFGVRFKIRPVGKLVAERSELPDGYRIMQVSAKIIPNPWYFFIYNNSSKL
jgi:hypothetical protein